MSHRAPVVALPTRTFNQPVATLIIEGVVTVLAMDRPAPARVIGHRVGVAAGASDRDLRLLALRVAHHNRAAIRVSNSLDHVCGWTGWQWDETYGTLPLGAIMGSATLADCLPIVDADRKRYGTADSLVVYTIDGHRMASYQGMDLTDQLAYSDFTPGRSAWVFEDAQPTTRRCPGCDGLGTYEDDPWPVCKVCDSAGHCPPIPWRGGPGFKGWEL